MPVCATIMKHQYPPHHELPSTLSTETNNNSNNRNKQKQTRKHIKRKKKKNNHCEPSTSHFFCSNLLSCFPFFIIRIPSHILSPIECSRQNQVSQVFRVERGVQRRHLWNDPGPGRFSTTNFFSFPTHLDVLKPKSAERFLH